MPTWTGKTFNKVVIGNLVARGGMAEVYEGDHTSLNRKVAVKIMRDHVDAEPETMARFEREARVIAGMRHQNIIQVYDYDVLDGQPALIMEYIPGASLAMLLKELHKRQEKIPLNLAVKILQQLASAIDYAHSLHIVHRDIKPANVLLRSASGPIDPRQPVPEDVEPILTDFGLVRLLDSSIQTSTGTVSGTPAYMSPEQARGDKVDARTDIYSMGVMLYEMLAGTVPFESESSFGVLMKHLNEPPPPIFGISPDLQTVIDRALAKDPEVRYQTARALAQEFTDVFNGQTISTDTARLRALAQKNKEKLNQSSFFGLNRPLTWIGVLILAGLITTAYFFGFGNPKNDNHPVGSVVYTDFNSSMDKATISITNLPPPKTGFHMEVWFLGQGGEITRNVGTVIMDSSGQGQLVFIDPEENNLVGAFDQIEITVEPDNDPRPEESSGEIAASYAYPPLALVHVRHLVSAFETAPNHTALIDGLWFSADSIAQSTDELKQAYESGDETLVQIKVEEIINQLVGNANKQLYMDWNQDGSIEDPGDGYGLLSNGDPGYNDQGYIPQVISHAKYAAQALDTTETIQTQSKLVIISAQNTEGWSKQLLDKAMKLQAMQIGPEMSPLIEEMVQLSVQIVSGTDSNENQIIEPIIGEGGAGTAFEHAYSMAGMQLLPGAHRMPQAVLPLK